MDKSTFVGYGKRVGSQQGRSGVEKLWRGVKTGTRAPIKSGV